MREGVTTERDEREFAAPFRWGIATEMHLGLAASIGHCFVAATSVDRAAEKHWGDSKASIRKKVPSTQAKMIERMKPEGKSITAISKAV